jgi:hypothetical protein
MRRGGDSCACFSRNSRLHEARCGRI